MTLHPFGLPLGLTLAFFSGCPSNNGSPVQSYDNCTPADTCSDGTTCLGANISGTGLGGDFCTNACDPTSGSGCSDSGTVCVAATGGTEGICYVRCTTDCPTGQSCVPAPSAGGLEVCVPGNGTGMMPTNATAYEPCTPAGSTCADGTVCQTAAVGAPGNAPGLVCSTGCTTASSCPGYAPGLVACVPVGSSMQCVATCMTNTDCVPFGTQCLSLSTSSGLMNICAP